MARERTEEAIALAESLWLPETLSVTLSTAGMLARADGQTERALALQTHALKLALEHELPSTALRAYNNLADLLQGADRYDEALAYGRRGLALARQVGDRPQEEQLGGTLSEALIQVGQWDEAAATATAVLADATLISSLGAVTSLVMIAVERGGVDEARDRLPRFDSLADFSDPEERAYRGMAHGMILAASGRHEEALAAATDAVDQLRAVGAKSLVITRAFDVALRAALAAGALTAADELLARLDTLRAGERPPSLAAHATRFRARLAAARGETDGVDSRFTAACALFRELGTPVWLAVTQLEHAEALAARGALDEVTPLLEEAREAFQRLGARPYLDRLDRLAPAPATAVA
jgi:tetratricopeptide (TPR) repeat protein